MMTTCLTCNQIGQNWPRLLFVGAVLIITGRVEFGSGFFQMAVESVFGFFVSSNLFALRRARRFRRVFKVRSTTHRTPQRVLPGV